MQVSDLFGKSRNLPTDPVAFVDPGSSGTGIALWEHLAALGPPDETDRWTPKRGTTWEQKRTACLEWFERWLGMSSAHLVVIEGVEVWGNAKSLSAASTGKTIKLARLVGGMEHVCAMLDVVWLVVSPNEWKAQLPKDAMKRRVKAALGVSYREHEWDAVAMGLAAQGRL